jgi:hypothetical protein
MKSITKRGSTANLFVVFLQDSASTTGAGKTGLTSASAGLVVSVRRELAASVTSYSGANVLSISTLGTWVDPGVGKVRFKEIDPTNQPGLYELQFVDSLFDGSDASRLLTGMVIATGVAPTPFEIELTAVDLQDALALGLARLDQSIGSRLSSASYTAPDNSGIASASASAASADGKATAIKAKTDALPAIPAATGDAMTLTSGERTSFANALLDLANGVESGETLRQCLRLLRAALVGKSAGFPNGPARFRDRADTRDRIAATVDADGNRTAVTVDVT